MAAIASGSLPRLAPTAGLASGGAVGSLTIGLPAAQAQAIDATTIENYARALLAIEPERQRAYQTISQRNGGQVPPIYCHRPESLSSLNSSIREIAVGYCERSIAIVEDNDLTIQEFNRITNALQQDQGLATRIQQQLIDLQN